MKRPTLLFLVIASFGCDKAPRAANAPVYETTEAVSFGAGGDEAPRPEPAMKSAALADPAAPPAMAAKGADSDGAASGGAAEAPARAAKAAKAAKPVQKVLPEAGQLTAGEWSDNSNWEFWRNLMTQGYESHLHQWKFDIARRVVVNVARQGAPARNVPVVLQDVQGQTLWSATTNGKGVAVLFGAAQASAPFSVKVGSSAATRVDGQELGVELSPNDATRVDDSIDVMFVVDTTGSMADELAYIQSELLDVTRQVAERTRNEFKLRVGASVYRDANEEYVVRQGPFSTTVGDSVSFLAAQSANGGGDFPEAVDEALESAMKQEWNPSARARLLFLVLDAPPHQDPAGMKRLHDAIGAAARRGIALIPVVGSGIDKNTEFLMRSMAVATNGTYVFLTSHSGIGGAHIEPTTGAYEVEKLNALLVRLIADAAS